MPRGGDTPGICGELLKEKPAAGITRRALLFIRSGRFLPETPETAEAISLAGRNASFLTLSIERTPEKRGKTR
jgi:hypothetical protein